MDARKNKRATAFSLYAFSLFFAWGSIACAQPVDSPEAIGKALARYRYTAAEPPTVVLKSAPQPSDLISESSGTSANRAASLPIAPVPDLDLDEKSSSSPSSPHSVLKPAPHPIAGPEAFPVSTRLTIADVRALAPQANPALQQAVQEAEALRGTWVQVGLKENPGLEYIAGEMKEGNAGKQGFGVSQTIIPKYKLNARQAAACREYEAAKRLCETRYMQITNDAVLAAYQVAVSDRKRQLLHHLLQIAQEALKAGEALLKAQEISRQEYLESKIQAERTRIALNDAEIAYRTDCKVLALLLALPESETIRISDPIETIPVELEENVVLTTIFSCSPEIRHAYARIETARARLRQECADAGIDFDINAQVLYNTDSRETEISAGIAIPLRVFNKNQGNIARARSELAAAHKNAQRVELALATRFQKAYGTYQTSRTRVLAYEKAILGEAQESLDLALEAYRQGQYGAIELLDAQRTLFNVRIEHIENLAAFWESQILLEGDLLFDGLESP